MTADAPRDGITVADDTGDEVTFNVNLVMHVKTKTDGMGRFTVGPFELYCGKPKPVATVATFIGGYGRVDGRGLACVLAEAVEDYLETHQPKAST